MEPLQTTLIIVLIALTLSAVAASVFFILVLVSLRLVIKKVELILSDIRKISEIASDPVVPIIKAILSVFPQAKEIYSSILKKKGKEK